MALLQTKWINDDAVNDLKVKLRNNQPLRARNAADDADVNVLKVDATNTIDFYSLPAVAGELLATQDYVNTEISSIVNVFTYKGGWNASTNNPELSDGTGTAGWVYRVGVAGTVVFTAGSITFEVGDKVVYVDGAWEKWDVIDNEFATSDTDDLAEGSTNFYYTSTRFDTDLATKDTDDLSEGTNLYFTEARVLDTDLAGYAVGTNTALAATDTILEAFQKTQGQINALASATANFATQVITLSAGDITNQYVTLANEPIAGSLVVFVKGSVPQVLGEDFEIDGVDADQVNFLGDLAALLVAGDKLVITYSY